MGDGAEQLEACPGCARHVRVSERRCPFCGTAIDLTGAPPPIFPGARLSRGELFSFRKLVGAGLIGTSGVIGACELPSAQPVYGAPCDPPDCGGFTPHSGGAGPTAGAGAVPTGGTSGSGGSSNGGISGSGGATGGVSGSGGSDAGASGAGGDDGAGGEGGG